MEPNEPTNTNKLIIKMEPNEPTNTNNFKKTSEWFNVYLCTETSSSSWSYECKMFNSFLEADNYYTKHYESNRPKSIMLDICKYTPYFLRKPILKYKLASQHKVNLSVYKNKN